jgi:two-component system chemotaxis response regulator CheB
MARPAPLTAEAADADLPVGRSVRVMLVDDSLVVRSILERIVDQKRGLEVCASVASAHDALAFLAREPVDVVVLDIEMPGMNGIDALPHILERAANARVLILSSNCVEGGPAAIDALALGASDTLAKPGRGSFSGRFAEVLTERIISLGQQRDLPAVARATHRPAPPPAPVAIDNDQPVECIAVAASTGGIPAFNNFLTHLSPRVTAPILLTQHLPDAFMEFFARQLAAQTDRNVCVAKAGAEIADRTIYISPGNAHLTCAQAGRRRKIEHLQHYSGSRYSPSVDALFESVADVYGRGALAIVLSGMGNDGASGAERLARNGARIIVQDADSCVVWGMPGAVAKAGLADAILPPAQISRLLNRTVQK